MKFPWDKYEELPASRKNTLQVFITNRCQMRCAGCFARNIMTDDQDITLQEYEHAVAKFKLLKDGQQINLIGGEPLLHPLINDFLHFNKQVGLKTTIYTNGMLLENVHFHWNENWEDVKLRVSIYCKSGGLKPVEAIPMISRKIEFCYMVGAKTTVTDLLESAAYIEKNFNCNVFFISSIRELDNPRHEFFDDTEMTMNLLKYKELVHEFLYGYKGNMEIHISKRGMFESTKTPAECHCRFANYFIGGKIIQCPYDIVNQKFQSGYDFGQRPCQHNSTCLMSKIIVRRK